MTHFARLLEFDGSPSNFVALHAIANEGKPKRASLYILYWYFVDTGAENWQIVFADKKEAEQSFRDACNGVFLSWRKTDTWLWAASGGGCLEYKPKRTWTEIQLPEGLFLREQLTSSRSKHRERDSRHALDQAIRVLDTNLSNQSSGGRVEVLIENVQVQSVMLRRAISAHRDGKRG